MGFQFLGQIDLLSAENNIPLTAIQIMKNDAIYVCSRAVFKDYLLGTGTNNG